MVRLSDSVGAADADRSRGDEAASATPERAPVGVRERLLHRALDENAPLLLAAARALTADEADARDLVQTTFEIALRKGDQVRDLTALPA